MMRDNILELGTLQISGSRLSVNIRMPWYRSLPLSSVCDLALDIDGHSVATDSITWTVEGIEYRPEELPPLFDRWWFVTDSATLAGDLPSEVAANLDSSIDHEVHTVLGIYIPYIDAGHGTLKVTESDRKLMKLEKRAANV